jgi:hypothetical protein
MSFKPPSSFIKASAARVEQLKLKKYEEKRPEVGPVPDSNNGDARLSTKEKVDQLKQKRDERRLLLQLKKHEKDQMSQDEYLIHEYVKSIDKFRIEFAKKRAQIKISTSTRDLSADKNIKIRVCIRKRPLAITSPPNFDVITTATDLYPFAHIYLHEPKVKLDGSKATCTHRFRFDNVYDENATNRQVYDTSIKPLVDLFLKGGRSTIFAYGQTGSGKTYTIFGSPKIPGIIDNVCNDIFKSLPPDYSLSVSFYEIYSNRVYDLLSERAKISLLEDARGYCQLFGQKEIRVRSLNELLQAINVGMAFRMTSSTKANNQSSRSHAVIQINLLSNDNQIVGKLSTVDLAGSERGVDTEYDNKQARQEGSEINKSLLALKECIRALHKMKPNFKGYVPFRASKLTQILRDSFIGKKSQTVMIAMIDPGSISVEHSLNTLRYADRVKEMQSPDELAASSAESMVSPTELEVEAPQFEDAFESNQVEVTQDEHDDFEDEEEMPMHVVEDNGSDSENMTEESLIG